MCYVYVCVYVCVCVCVCVCNICHSVPCVFGSRTNLSDMTAFFHSVRGYDDPSQQHLHEMLLSLKSARAAIVMMGDSTLNVSSVV